MYCLIKSQRASPDILVHPRLLSSGYIPLEVYLLEYHTTYSRNRLRNIYRTQLIASGSCNLKGDLA
jgi:hypothetical protein